MDTKQKLGIKVFYYYLSKRISFGIILLVVSIIVAFSKISLISKLSSLISLNGAITIINYLVYILFIISVLLILGALFISWLSYINCDYTLSENALSIRRGILTKKEVSIPYRQIQNIDIEQSFNYRMMGVSKLVILTAGNDNKDKEGEAEGIFEIIDSDNAKKIKEYILEKSNIQILKES